MILGLKALTNPVKLTKYTTVHFYGDVSEWTDTQTECSILGIELVGNLVIGGFFWSTKISKPAIIIGDYLGFSFSTKDEIRRVQKNKVEIIEIWNILVDKFSAAEDIWYFLENLESGEDSESLRSLIQSKSEEVAEQDLVSESNWQDFELEGSYTAIQIIPEGRFDEVNKIVSQKKMYIPD